MMLNEEIRDKLVHLAIEVRKRSYSPYSNYSVGAALLATSGKIYSGANVENAVYPMTICAERAAVVKAISEGDHEFEAIAVVTRDGGTPCGACRQVLAEFGLETAVLIADDSGKVLREMTVAELLPESFGPSNLLD
jgi:cytidine deaminase